MAGSNVPFFRGQNVRFKLYQDNKPVSVAGKNWEVSQNAVEVADGVNGELRDRLDIVTNYFEATVDIYQQDQTVMNMLMAAQEANDAQGLPSKQACTIFIKHRDGTASAYLLQGAVFGPWKKTAGGRAEAVMLNLKVRFTDYKQVQAIG